MTNCPACDNQEPVTVGLGHGDYQLCRCLTCDLMFWHPLRPPDPQWYQGWPVDFAGVRPVSSPHTAYQKFFRDRPTPGGRLLDVGCGTGEFCYSAERAGYSVTGIDLSPRFIEAARQRFPSLDLEALSLGEFLRTRHGEKYDIVTFIQVLEHLGELRDFLGLVKSLLKPGGYVLCAVPNRDRWRLFSWRLREDWDYPPNHFTWWNDNCLARLFRGFGFSIRSLEIDPLTPFDCSFLLSEKLRLTRMAEWLGRKVIGGAAKPGLSSPGPRAKRLGVARLGYRLYNQALLPLCGMVTFPLLPLLRKGGNSIYLLARLEG